MTNGRARARATGPGHRGGTTGSFPLEGRRSQGAQPTAGQAGGEGKKAARPEQRIPQRRPPLDPDNPVHILLFSYQSVRSDRVVHSNSPANPISSTNQFLVSPLAPRPTTQNGDFYTPYADSSGSRPPSGASCLHSPSYRSSLSASRDVRLPCAAPDEAEISVKRWRGG
jgi:hypothetical protein